MNKIPFSVVMSVYYKDNAIFFDRALQSIIEYQTVKPDEIVLVADGPLTNELNKVIKKYEEKYCILRIIRLEENYGLGNALRIAVNECNNEIIARMDSDDVSVENRFEQQIEYMCMNPEVDIVGGDITEFINWEHNVVGKRKVPKTDKEIKEYMKKRCALNHVSVMYKKSAVLSSGGYKDWFWNEDYYLWIRMLENNCMFANTGSVLVNVRVGKEMYSRRGGAKYFKSEIGLQKYMLKHKIITPITFLSNCIKRIIVQLMMSNNVRSWVFKRFARE